MLYGNDQAQLKGNYLKKVTLYEQVCWSVLWAEILPLFLALQHYFSRFCIFRCTNMPHATTRTSCICLHSISSCESVNNMNYTITVHTKDNRPFSGPELERRTQQVCFQIQFQNTTHVLLLLAVCLVTADSFSFQSALFLTKHHHLYYACVLFITWIKTLMLHWHILWRCL